MGESNASLVTVSDIFGVGKIAESAAAKRLADAVLSQLLCLELTEPAPDGGGSKAHVFADLPNTQALGFDHLNNLQFKAGVEDSSGFRIAHVCCRFSFDNLSLCLFKLDHHISQESHYQYHSTAVAPLLAASTTRFHCGTCARTASTTFQNLAAPGRAP